MDLNATMTSSENFHYLLHHEITNDILQTIPDEDLPALRDIFRFRWPYAIQTWRFMHQFLTWKLENPKVGIRVTAPDGDWRDGTFVAIMTEYNYQVFFFTLEKSCKRLCKALKETKLIEWKKGPYIFAIHEHQEKNVLEILRNVSGEIEFEIESATWWLPKEEALKFKIKCPENVTIKPLLPAHAAPINLIWTHKFPGSENYLINLIVKNGGYGIFLNSLLCSWIMTNDYGAVAILQTLDEHKRKGYASLLIKYLSKKAAERNLDSVTYIVRKNVVSQAVFKSLGYRINNNIRWVQFKQLESRKMRSRL